MPYGATTVKTNSDLEKVDKAIKLDKWFCQSVEATSGWRERVLRNYALVEGHPEAHFGSAEILTKMRAKRIPANVWNLILPKIELLSALANSNQLDIKTSARGMDDDEVNDIMNSQIKYVQDINQLDVEVAAWFDDSAICGLGWLEAIHDDEYTEDIINGDVYLGRLFPLCITWDYCSQRYDCQDGRFITKAMWYEREQAQELFPGADLSSRYFGSMIDDQRLGKYSQYSHMFYNRTTDQVRILNHYYKEKAIANIVLNIQTGESQQFWEKSKAEDLARTIIQLSNSNRFIRVVQREVDRVRLGITIGHNLVQDDWDERNSNLYPFIPLWARHFSDNKIFGFVDPIEDPQLEINKRMSQTLQVTVRSVNSPTFVPKGSLSDDDIRAIRDGKSSPIIEYDSTKGKPDTPQPNQIPSALVDLTNTARYMNDIISGIQPELAGQTQGVAVSGVAGKAVQARQSGSILSISRFTRNLAASRKILGKHIVKLVQQYHPPEKMLRIIGQPKNQIGSTAGLMKLGIDAAMAKIKTTGLIPFDIVVDQSPATTTARQGQFLQAMQMIQVGIPYPPEILIELSDSPRKDEVLASLAKKGMQPSNPAVGNVINAAKGAQDGGSVGSALGA